MRVVLLTLALLAGCASHDFRDGLGAAYAAVDATAQTVRELCASPTEGGPCVGSISTETRDAAREQLYLALDILAEARMHYADGSADLATERLRQARALLRVVEQLLESKA